MRPFLMIAATLACFGMAGTASAQSGQGDYLGLNPGKGAGTFSAPATPLHGSGQGGYLGLNPGAGISAGTARTAPSRGSGQGGYLGLNPAGRSDRPVVRAPADPA
jgi:hypothetical protein